MSNRYAPDKYKCNDGHILYSDNVYIDGEGWTMCKACDQIEYDRKRSDPEKVAANRESSRKWRERKRLAS